MDTCYVSLPFGVRTTPDGRPIDFDQLYTETLQPTLRELGIDCRRLEEFAPGTSWHRSLFAAILGSDLMIADVSTHNPNVMYELGIRHAARRSRTLTISAGGRLPSNVAQIQALWYEPDADGRLVGPAADEFRARLRNTVEMSRRSTISDSPVFDAFPELEVWLPPDLESPTPWRIRKRGRTASGVGGLGASGRAAASPEQRVREVRQREEELRSGGADPIEFLTLLRSYRDASAWDELIRAANDAPDSVRNSAEVRQLLALALNRRGAQGDQDHAIALMEQLIADTGGDAETYGVLGRIYKDRHEAARARGDTAGAAADLERALDCYRNGFARNPRDTYNGANVVMLLLERGDASAQAELASIVPQVLAAVRERTAVGRPDFWDLATQVQLASAAGDWGEAEGALRRATELAGPGWMLDALRGELEALAARLPDPAQRSRVQSLAAQLAGTERTEASRA